MNAPNLHSYSKQHQSCISQPLFAYRVAHNINNLCDLIGHKDGKVCQSKTLVMFLENIHKVYFNVLKPWILFKSMINNYKLFDFIT
jgi:hypothetical protein